MILSGAGQLKLDDEIFAVPARGAVRVAPDVARAPEAGRDGVESLPVGPHHAENGEPVDDSWVH